MTEIGKLKQRLSNIGRNVFEYKMTVAEAKQLSKEFDEYERTIDGLNAKIKELENKLKESKTSENKIVILDGGSLT